MDTKIIGYSLLSLGLIIAVVALLNLYSILNGKAQAFNYFSFEPIAISSEAFLGTEMSPQEMQMLKQQSGGELPKIEIASSKLLSDTTNLIAHLFILGSIASIAIKISLVGVQLVRPVKVHLNQENGQTNKKIQTK